MNLLRAATLMVADPQATAKRYVDWLDYEIVEQGSISADLAESWGTPAMAGRAFLVARPASGADVFLRFVQGHPPQGYRALRTFGWAALEICVSDTVKVAERMARSPFDVIGPPRELDGMPEIFPMQVKGPDEEIVYLTQIRSQPAGVRLTQARSLIDQLFILVMACSNLGDTKRFFEEKLGLTAYPEVSIRYTMLSKAFDLEPDTKHTIATGGHEIDTFLEFDQYPAQATPRPRRPGELPPGISMVTLAHPDMDVVSSLWLRPPQPRRGTIYGDKLQAVTTAPDGTLVECLF